MRKLIIRMEIPPSNVYTLDLCSRVVKTFDTYENQSSKYLRMKTLCFSRASEFSRLNQNLYTYTRSRAHTEFLGATIFDPKILPPRLVSLHLIQQFRETQRYHFFRPYSLSCVQHDKIFCFPSKQQLHEKSLKHDQKTNSVNVNVSEILFR